jgi:predicted SAM-dependent methyltransferase
MNLLKKFSPSRPISDYSKVQAFYSNLIRGSKLQLKNKRIASKLYLDIGCGPNIHNEFIGLDYNWKPGLDLCWDITQGIPIQDNSLLGVYTEHCIEHISYGDVCELLEEIKRILKPEGTLRIIVPDAELYLDLYMKGRSGEKVKFPYGTPAYKSLNTEKTPMMEINQVFRGHGHQFAYDYLTLEAMLQTAGFVSIKKESFRCGRDRTLLIDSEHRACESLYVEACAP